MVPLACLVGVVVLLSSVTPVIKYVFQHSHVQPLGLACFRVMIGFLLRISYEVSRAERVRDANLTEPRDLIGGMPSGATA